MPTFTVSADKAPSPSQATTKAAPPAGADAGAGAGDAKIVAPMAGKVVAVKAAEGDTIKKGDTVFILEAMKMENSILATASGTVVSISVNVGDIMKKGNVMCTIKTGG